MIEAKIRKEIQGDESVMDIVLLMSEGNPGAVQVISKIMEVDKNSALMSLLYADGLNIRGSQLWAAFKVWADGDALTLMDGLKNANIEMITIVNEACPEFKAAGVG